MKRNMLLNETKLLAIRSKMITELLFEIISEQSVQNENFNTPIYKVTNLVPSLIDTSQNDDKSVTPAESTAQ